MDGTDRAPLVAQENLMVTPAPVFVVDDDCEVREALAAVLENEGYSVRCAANGAQALAMMHGSRPAAILVDLMMPVMSGWELIEAIHDDGDLASIPLVILSAMRAPEGFLHISKPVSLDELLTTVHRACRSA
jgi:CheY-like chemotaxis protein